MCFLWFSKCENIYVCKNSPYNSKAWAPNTLFVLLPLILPCDDISSLHMPTNSHLLLAFVAKVVAKMVPRVIHSHILDQILSQICTDVFEKFPFQEREEEVKSYNYCLFM